MIGQYTDDFYQGTPAITCKCTGKGKTYYQAARCSFDDLTDFIKGLLEEAGMETKNIPYGIEYHRRIGDTADYEFYLNLTSENIELTDVYGIDMVTGNRVEGCVNLKDKEYLVLKTCVK